MRVHPWDARAVVLKINFDQAVFRYVRLRLFKHRTLLRCHSPSLQNFRALAGSCRNENFCKSAYVSVSNPKMNIPVPVESRCVIVFGAFGCECRGELTIITGSDTTNTHTACYRKRKKDNRNLIDICFCVLTWNVQNTANRMTFFLLSSNCLSRPIFTIRYSRYADSRAPQTQTNAVTISCRES